MMRIRATAATVDDGSRTSNSRRVHDSVTVSLPPFQTLLDDAQRGRLAARCGRWSAHRPPRTASRRRSSPRCVPTRACVPTPSPRAWLLTIAHNKAIDHLRRGAHAARRGRRGDRRRPAAPATQADLERGRGAAAAPASRGGAALHRRPLPPRDRGRDRLLGGGLAAIPARRTRNAEEAAVSDPLDAGPARPRAPGARRGAPFRRPRRGRARRRPRLHDGRRARSGELLLVAGAQRPRQPALPRRAASTACSRRSRAALAADRRVRAGARPVAARARRVLRAARRTTLRGAAGLGADVALPARILRATAAIPFGGTSTYTGVATAAGKPARPACRRQRARRQPARDHRALPPRAAQRRRRSAATPAAWSASTSCSQLEGVIG